jgi:hypothetical protein
MDLLEDQVEEEVEIVYLMVVEEQVILRQLVHHKEILEEVLYQVLLK